MMKRVFCLLFLLASMMLSYAQKAEAVKLYQEGRRYEKGKGVEENREKAASLYQKAAEMGLDSAQCALGSCYEYGKGVNIDINKAVEWYRKAAAQNYNRGMVEMGVCYYEGKGVPQNYERAKELIEQVLKKNPKHKGANIYLQRVNKRLEEQHRLQTAMAANVDKGIPVAESYDMNTFAVIIGNEEYAEDAAVPYAENDAKIFKEYVQRTFGVPENQINYITNAGLNKIRTSVRWLAKAMEVTGGKGKAIFYYAGHGIPNESDKSAYLLPVDGISGDVESAYPLSRLYQELGNIPAQQIMVFLDASFSGAKREGGMLASARGVAVKAKSVTPKGNLVVFTASQDDETAFAYKSQQHGMFTYYLLKKLQETKGETTLGALSDYLTTEVKRQAFEENNKTQTPTVIPSQALTSNWQTMKLR